MNPKYINLRHARSELIEYLDGIGEYHITRSIIERTIGDIDKVIKCDPTVRVCTPKVGYVDQKLNEIGD